MDWGGLYARICAQTGWTWEYVGQHLTLPRLKALNAHWQKNPPLQEQVLQLLTGLGGAPGSGAEPTEYGSFDELVAAFSAAGGTIG